MGRRQHPARQDRRSKSYRRSRSAAHRCRTYRAARERNAFVLRLGGNLFPARTRDRHVAKRPQAWASLPVSTRSHRQRQYYFSDPPAKRYRHSGQTSDRAALTWRQQAKLAGGASVSKHLLAVVVIRATNASSYSCDPNRS